MLLHITHQPKSLRDTQVWGSSEHGQLGIGSLPTEDKAVAPRLVEGLRSVPVKQAPYFLRSFSMALGFGTSNFFQVCLEVAVNGHIIRFCFVSFCSLSFSVAKPIHRTLSLCVRFCHNMALLGGFRWLLLRGGVGEWRALLLGSWKRRTTWTWRSEGQALMQQSDQKVVETMPTFFKNQMTKND